MRTLVHISDLHFGRTEPQLVKSLREAITIINPHLVIASGDLTQRARSHEFIEAAQFLDSLPGGKVVVAGNHDIPLYDLIRRFIFPLRKYKRHIGIKFPNGFHDDEIDVEGITSAHGWTIAEGRNRNRDLHHLLRKWKNDKRRVRVLVSHHGLSLPESTDSLKIDLHLSGHHHLAVSEVRHHGSLCYVHSQAGTAISTRLRGEDNSFNVIRILNPQEIEIDLFVWKEGQKIFAQKSVKTFKFDHNVWSSNPAKVTS